MTVNRDQPCTDVMVVGGGAHRVSSSNEAVEAATSSYSTTGEFLRYIHSVLVVKSHQKIRSRYLVHEFYLTDIFFYSGLYGFILLL